MRGNVEPRAGRWSAAHRKPATFGWPALVVPAVALGSTAGTTMPTDAEGASDESAKAQRILTAAGVDKSTGEATFVLPRSRSLRLAPVAAVHRRVDVGRARLAPNLLFRVYERRDVSMDDHVFILSRSRSSSTAGCLPSQRSSAESARPRAR
jgi:hypothetical protein